MQFVDGKPINVMQDTGAQPSVFDMFTAEMMNLPYVVREDSVGNWKVTHTDMGRTGGGNRYRKREKDSAQTGGPRYQREDSDHGGKFFDKF